MGWVGHAHMIKVTHWSRGGGDEGEGFYAVSLYPAPLIDLMSTQNTMLGGGFKAERLRVNLRLVINRLKLLEKKKSKSWVE